MSWARMPPYYSKLKDLQAREFIVRNLLPRKQCELFRTPMGNLIFALQRYTPL